MPFRCIVCKLHSAKGTGDKATFNSLLAYNIEKYGYIEKIFNSWLCNTGFMLTSFSRCINEFQSLQ